MADAVYERCLAFAEEYDMLPAPGGKMLCAVSGGADSVCLLLLMRRAGRERGFSVVCAHYDHRLRGEESARDAAFVRALCERLDVPFVLGSADVRAAAENMGCGIEEAARTLRYDFLGGAARREGAEKIATAHNADDNAETMLLNLARGAGSAGLAGIPPVRHGVVRPLLCLERREIEAWLHENGETWVTDSSNLTDDYARNRLRHAALPVLREVNPAFARHAMEAAARLREDDRCLTALAECFLQENARSEAGSIVLPVQALAELPEGVYFRVLQKICGKALEACHARAVRGLLAPERSGASADLPGMCVRRSFDRLYFGAADELPPLETRTLDENGEVGIPECGITVRRTDGVPCEIHDSFNIFYFQMTGPCGKITIRSKKPGDSLRIPGRGCTKSLKKLFAEAQIPAWERERIPVLADEAGVLAVLGFGAEESRLALPGERAVRIEIEYQGEGLNRA